LGACNARLVYVDTRLRAGRPVFESRQWQEIFLFPELSRQVLDPPSLLVSGYRNSFPRATGSRRDADDSPLSSIEVNDELAVMSWRGTTLPFLTLLLYLKYLEFSCVSAEYFLMRT
jgi:hypothetical protein